MLRRLSRGARRLALRLVDPVDHGAFVERFFAPGEYEGYVADFEAGPAAEILEAARERYHRLTEDGDFGALGLDVGRDLYALVRKLEPETVVETGVCNGVSSLCLLLGLTDAGAGRLYSVDYPYRADEELGAFRGETFAGYGGAALPPDEDPGWLVPDRLRERWTLALGKSQRELPRLLAGLEGIDLFLHDSEHSLPCMLFEFELAWAWLRPGGLLLSDDIDWNEAFATFAEARDAERGRITRSVGWMAKADARGATTRTEETP